MKNHNLLKILCLLLSLTMIAGVLPAGTVTAYGDAPTAPEKGAETCTITFVDITGKIKMGTKTVEKGADVNFSMNEPYGYFPNVGDPSFQGWYLDQTFSGAQLEAYTVEEDMTVYAKWVDYLGIGLYKETKDGYEEIKYDGNGVACAEYDLEGLAGLIKQFWGEEYVIKKVCSDDELTNEITLPFKFLNETALYILVEPKPEEPPVSHVITATLTPPQAGELCADDSMMPKLVFEYSHDKLEKEETIGYWYGSEKDRDERVPFTGTFEAGKTYYSNVIVYPTPLREEFDADDFYDVDTVAFTMAGGATVTDRVNHHDSYGYEVLFEYTIISPDEYIVSFETYSYDSAPEKQIVIEGGKATDPQFTPSNVEFTGWYKDKDWKEKFDFNTAINSNMTLYAGLYATITFELNGRGEAIDPMRVALNSDIVLPKASSEGYTMDWCIDKDLTELYDPGDGISGNITLYADWKKIEVPEHGVTITIDGQDEGVMPKEGFTATISIDPALDAEVLAVLAAFYDENGRFLGLRPIPIDPDTKEGSLAVEPSPELNAVKVFAVEKEGFVPMTETEEIVRQDNK